MPFLTVNGFDLHYECQERGETPILLLHGNFASWRWWKPFLQGLPDGYRAYAPDLRGCGDSSTPEAGFTIEQMAQDALALADHLNLEQFHLVGHSLGGAIAQELCGTHSDRILSLSLISPAPANGLDDMETKRSTSIVNLLSPETTFNLVNKLGIQRSSFLTTFKRILPGIPQDVFFDQLVNDAMRIDQNTFEGFVHSLRDWRGTQYLKKISCPVLILCGDADQVVEPESLLNMRDEIPDCRFACWKRVGHGPMLEHPDAFNSLLLKFVQGKVEQADLPVSEFIRGQKLWQRLRIALKRLVRAVRAKFN